MVLCNQITVEAGHPLSLPFIDKLSKQFRKSLVKSTTGDITDLSNIIKESIKHEKNHSYNYNDNKPGISYVSTVVAFGISLVLESLYFI